MRIGIDFTPAIQQQAGIGRYTRELVRALARLDTVQPVRAVPGKPGRERSQPASGPITSAFGPSPSPIAGWPFSGSGLRLPVPVETFTGAVDIFHSPDFVLPPVRRARTVLTVHDLSFLTTPQTSEPALRAYLSEAVPRAVARADHILADSRSTKRDLVTHLNADPEKITVVYPGVDPRFQRLEEPAIAEVRTRYGLERPFVLSVGTLQPRKNYPTLIEAFARLSSVDLVIAGGPGWLYQEIFDTVDRLGMGERVSFLGLVRDEDLPALYNAAEVLAMPSLYEGFGLPVLEALACGTPVVTSDVSSLPEVACDAALLVSPHDVEGISQALLRALTDQELRAALRERGLIQAKQFTWQKAAETVLGIYQRLM